VRNLDAPSGLSKRILRRHLESVFILHEADQSVENIYEETCITSKQNEI
jgi:hypothetical protein